MATINSLTSLTTPASNDLLAIWDSNAGTGEEPTKKMSIGDFVVDNLTSTATNKPLSAAQGKALNDKIASLIKTESLTISGSVPPNYNQSSAFNLSVVWNNYANKSVIGIYLINAEYPNWCLWGTPMHDEPNHTINVGIRNYFSDTLTVNAVVIIKYMDT